MASDPSPAARYLLEEWDSLRDYNFEWVAADAEHVIAHNEDLGAVIEAVLERSDPVSVVYALVDFEQVEYSGQGERF
jgi:hypothetical protein